MSRENQGKDFGNLPFPGLTGDNEEGNFYGEVVCGITGPGSFGEIESRFQSDFSLSSNTSETGGVFFEGNRRLFTNTFVFDGTPYLGMGLSGSYANPDVDGIIGSWLYYARGFTGGGFTGATNESSVNGYTSGATYEGPGGSGPEEITAPHFISIMDLPTVPYGTYGSDTSEDGDGRDTNKVLNIFSTGETFSANFRSSNTNVLFSINHAGVRPDDVGTSNLLTVCTYRRDNRAEQLPADEVQPIMSRESFRRFNRGQQSLEDPESSKYSLDDQKYMNQHTDLCFIFHGNDNDDVEPSGNVLKLDFPVPVRGFCLQVTDCNALHNPTNADIGKLSYRTVVEGDHVDGSTFTYIMYNRTTGGGESAGGTNPATEQTSSFTSRNRADAVSYLALNSRNDKHIKTLYVSAIHQPVGISFGSAAHLDHGLTDMIGPARYYCNGGAFDGSVAPGTSGGLTLSDGVEQNTQADAIAVKLSVMPRYKQNHWQKEMRGDQFGGSPHNDALFNEWRKIARNQKGKTFGLTGSRDQVAVFGDFDFGFGVTFGASASTGTTLGITMGFRNEGDQFSNYTETPPVEAFQYEVIKGATVDGAFIPVWKKTRTI